MARTLAALAAAISTAALTAGTAAADPVNNPNTAPLPLTCANGFSGTIYPTGNAGHDAGSTTVGVLKGIVSPEGSFFVAGWDASELTACTSPGEPGVTFYVLIAPRGR